MLSSFEVNKVIHQLLFVIHSFGGKMEMYRLFAILYFSDLQHLQKYGRSVTGDSYIAMKDSSVPFNVLNIYKHLTGDTFTKGHDVNLKEFFSIDAGGQIVAISQYTTDMIAETEIECLFEVIHIYKSMTDDVLYGKMKDNAWHLSDRNGSISLHHLLHVNNIPADVVSYVEGNVFKELHAFTEAGEVSHRKNGVNHAAMFNLNIGAVIRDNTGDGEQDFVIIGTSLNDYAMAAVLKYDDVPASLKSRLHFFPVRGNWYESEPLLAVDCSRLIVRRFGVMSAWIKKYPDALLGQLPSITAGEVIKTIAGMRTIPKHMKKGYSLLDNYALFY